MTSNYLKQLFDLVERKAHDFRKKDIRGDGQQFWHPIKKILASSTITADTWKHIKKDYHKVMNEPEYYINGHGEKHIIEMNHFLIQSIRIPLTEKPSLRKIIQLALNIGQYTGSGGTKKEWMSLDKYLSKNNISKINSQLNESIIMQINAIHV